MTLISIEDLRKVHALSDLPDQLLQWILDHSEYVEFQDGEVIVRYGEPIDSLWIILEGGSAFYKVVNGQEIYFFTFENNKETGGITGMLPYSRMKTSVGNAYAVTRVRIIRLHKKHFLELFTNDFYSELTISDSILKIKLLEMQQCLKTNLNNAISQLILFFDKEEISLHLPSENELLKGM